MRFLKQFDVVRLKYDRVDVSEVMRWYDAIEAPFDDGKKRKEFPDAFAIAILAAYAKQSESYVAVVSHDQDFKKACDRFGSLMYFHSLPVLTEMLLSAEDSRIATFRASLDASWGKLIDAAIEGTIGVVFYPHNDYSELEDNNIDALNITEVRIVALGEHECTIAFDAVIRVKHSVRWSEPGPDDETEYRRERVDRDYDVSGTAKASFDPATNALVSVPYVALNEEVIEATDLPPHWNRW